MSSTSPVPLTVDSGTRLAVERTRLAYERTLMAWVRTAASLISFGFTIYKFFQFEWRDKPPVDGRLIGPREFALILIAIGLFSLLTAAIQHRRDMQQLRTSFGVSLPRSTAGLVAALFSVLGIASLLVVLLRQ